MIDENQADSSDQLETASDVSKRFNIQLNNRKIDDTLRYSVYATKALAQETVRISVSVTVLVHPHDAIDKVLAERVTPALKDFIHADWVISGLDRRADTAGYERVTLQAFARVAFAENFNLANRAHTANREGISISNPEVNRSLSAEKVAETVKELWFTILENVNAQIPHFNQITGRIWRVGDIDYAAPDRNREVRYSKGASSSEIEQYFSEGNDVSFNQGSERISLSAKVTLRADAP